MKSRRDVLKAAAATSLAAACGRAPPLSTKPPDLMEPGPEVAFANAGPSWERAGVGDPAPVVTMNESAMFPLGISSGDPANDRAVLQCRYTGQNPLELRVWSDERVLKLPVTVADYGFVHADVAGLDADTLYSYAFVELGSEQRRSPVGRFRSALPETSKAPLVLGAVSCTSTGRSLDALKHASERDDLNAFLFLGDTAYCDGASSLQQYRDKWQGSLGRPLYRALRQNVPVIATWDDHEVDNDWNPELTGMTKLANARASFFEHLPIRRDAQNPDRVWKSIRFGHTAEVFVLDSRSERRPSTVLSSMQQYLSPEQLTWLKAALVSSPCTFKVLMNSVPISQFPFSPLNPDSWNLYSQQRRELLEFIDANVTGALWVSGDHHFASCGRVSPTGAGSTQLEALAGPGAQSSNVLWRTLTGQQFDWASGDNNYLAIHLDPATRGVRLVFWSVDGQRLQDQRYTL